MDKDERQRGSVWPKAPIFRCRAFDDAPYLAAPGGAADRTMSGDRRGSIISHNRIKRKGSGEVVGRRHQRVALTDRASMDKDERQRVSVA